MAEEVFSPASPTPGIRRSFTVDESRHRPANRFSASSFDAASPSSARRRSSNFSDYSLNEARKTFQSSTDDLLLPRPSATGLGEDSTTSGWHSAPLVFALLPALGGMLFQNGSSVVTDITLLGLAGIFLNWSVRLPWDWYHSAQSLRKSEEYNGDTIIDDDDISETALEASNASLDDVPEDGPAAEKFPSSERETKSKVRRLPAHEKAVNELYTHEILALLSCFLFPVLGAYLLHTIRSSLSRPSEGLVSNYNLTIFLLASELRPMSHLVKLIQARTLHLQRIANSNPYNNLNGEGTGDIQSLLRRIEELEVKSTPGNENATAAETIGSPDPHASSALINKATASIATSVRQTLQPDLDALNRAVRRYEKRATLQTMQTEARLQDLDARLADAIALAAAAAKNGQRSTFGSVMVEWIGNLIVLPVQAFGALAVLPFKTIVGLINYFRTLLLGRRQVDSQRREGKLMSSSSGGRTGYRVGGERTKLSGKR